MPLKQYKRHIGSDLSRCASLPGFFGSGVKRTLNVLSGKARIESVRKRLAFGARHFELYKKNPTERRRVALMNWGFVVKKSFREKENCF